MLLTYRLVFGQDSESWRLFAREVSRRAKAKEPCITRVDDADPMLWTLCGRSCDADGTADIYEEIGADTFQAYYMPNSYPFFADRLLAVQGYVKGQNPHDWKALWHDHRNKSNWWQFWVSRFSPRSPISFPVGTGSALSASCTDSVSSLQAVLFIGGGTLVLGTLSLVFQIWQVVLSQQQLIASSSASSGSAGSAATTQSVTPSR
jgi:hypothetical protein